MKRLVVAGILLLTARQYSAQQISKSNIQKDIAYLASDKLQGRGTATEQEKLAADYIAAEFKRSGLAPLNGAYLRPFVFKKSTNPHDTATGNAPEKKSANVAGFLDNKAPYTIVIGAHYDHLGLGHDHNSLDANPEGKIHNGADDNASGTAGVLELARYYAGNQKTEPFNFLFLCFSGEELGLLGSKKWCENPDIPLSTINYMINMDMIGRLNDSTKKMIVYGVGTSPVFVPLLDSIASDLRIKKDSAGVGPSDQTSFYLRNLPVLHFFTGQHSDYHKPTDDVEKINFEGEVQVLAYITKFIEHTFHYPKLGFLKTRSPDTGKSSFKVTLGVMPDYTFEGKGMRIDGVTEGKPAAKAGILAGDVVSALGGETVTDVMSYMKVLYNYKKGDTAKIQIQRKGQSIEMNVTF